MLVAWTDVLNHVPVGNKLCRHHASEVIWSVVYSTISTYVKKPSGTSQEAFFMYKKESESLSMLPERRYLEKRPSEGKKRNNKHDRRYILYRNREEFEKAFDTKAYRQSWNYISLQTHRDAILAAALKARKADSGQRKNVDQQLSFDFGDCFAGQKGAANE